VILFLFITLLSQIQMYRLRINQKTEQEMTSLQMKAIKNQIDPHFTFNVLNAIGSLYANETDRNRADYIFGKYAKMIRQTVVTSDQIIVTLAEELDFIRNYLDIERFRCDDSFDYSVIVDDDEYMDIRIPRMLILTFVENAVKYGIRSRNNMGNIKIDISRSKKNLTVVVENSGPGPETLTNNAQATGRGLVILNELIELYFRLEKVKIRYRLGNMYGGNNIITGTSAVITIPV
jgi:LytS/YehU family sensor histidine kinase